MPDQNEGQARVGLVARLEEIQKFIQDAQAFQKSVQGMQAAVQVAASQMETIFTRAISNIRNAMNELGGSGMGMDAVERRIRAWNALLGRQDPYRRVTPQDPYQASFQEFIAQQRVNEDAKAWDDWAKAQEKAYRDARRRAKAYAQWQETGWGPPPPGVAPPGAGGAGGRGGGGWGRPNLAGGAPEFMPGMPPGLDWGRGAGGGGFWERFQKEAVRMGALRGGLFWRFARAAGGPMMGVAAGVYVAQRAIEGLQAVWESMNEAVAETDRQIRAGMAWETMATQADISADRIVSSAVKLSHYTVKEYEVIQEGNRLLLSDYEHIAEAIPDLMERAYSWAPKLGKTTQDAFSDLISAVEKGDAEAFRQYGLFEEINTALEEYSEKWRVAIEDMSDAEKQLVTLNAVLQELPPSLTDVTAGVTTSAEQFTMYADARKSLRQMLWARAGNKFFEFVGGLSTDRKLFTEGMVFYEELERILQRRDLVIRGISEALPGMDVSGILGPMREVEQELLNLMNSMEGAKDWDLLYGELEGYAEAVDEAWQRANVQLMTTEINKLLQAIADGHDDSEQAEKDAWAIAAALVGMQEAANNLDPEAMQAFAQALSRLRTIAGLSGLPGFEEESAVAREIRLQEEFTDLQEDLLDGTERWGMQLADVLEDDAKLFELVDQYQTDVINNLDPAIMNMSEFERKLYIKRHITDSWDDLLDKMEEASKPPSASDIREWNKYLLLTGGGGSWVKAFAAEHGGRVPTEQYKKHADPMVAAVIDKLWAEDFQRKHGRAPTDAEWQQHWYEQWMPLELFPGGPIAASTGPEAERAKAWIKLAGYAEDLGKAEHEAWMKTQELIPSIEEHKTQEEVLSTYISEHTVPSLETWNEKMIPVLEGLEDLGGKLGRVNTKLGDILGDESEGGPVPPGTTGQPGETFTDSEGNVWEATPGGWRLVAPGMQHGGVTRGAGMFMLHPNELVLPLDKLINMTSMRMGSGMFGGGGVNIGSLNVPVSIGSGVGLNAGDVQQAVVNAIRGRGGTALMRQARRLGVV